MLHCCRWFKSCNMKYNFCFLPNLVLYRSLSQMMYCLSHRRPLCSILWVTYRQICVIRFKVLFTFLSISVQVNGGISCPKITHESLRKVKNKKMEYGIFFTYNTHTHTQIAALSAAWISFLYNREKKDHHYKRITS